MIYLGVDLGGTKINAALVRGTELVSPIVTVPTPRTGPRDLLDAVAAACAQLLTDGAPLAGIGIGTAGLVDTDRGMIVSATKTLPGWPGTQVAREISQRLRPQLGAPVPVKVINDVDAHALGEFTAGAARTARSCVLITVGTGVGAGVILGGALHTGAHHGAGEIGHMPVAQAATLTCTCGRLGHLEAVASGTGVERNYTARTAATLSAAAIGERIDHDEAARACIQDAAIGLGQGIAACVSLLDPQVVVLGGGMSRLGDLWWSTVRDTVRLHTIDIVHSLEIIPTQLGDTAALLGAAAAARTS